MFEGWLVLGVSARVRAIVLYVELAVLCALWGVTSRRGCHSVSGGVCFVVFRCVC